MFEDLRWFGLRWSEGPDCGGPYAPYEQSERLPHYLAAFERLRAGGLDLSLHLLAAGCAARAHGAARRARRNHFIPAPAAELRPTARAPA